MARRREHLSVYLGICVSGRQQNHKKIQKNQERIIRYHLKKNVPAGSNAYLRICYFLKKSQPEVCLMHLFLVADKSNQSTSYATNFGSWYFGFVFARWSSLSRTSLFLMFEVIDNTDDDFDTADNDDGNDAKKRSINNQEDTVEGVENNGDDLTTNEPTTADTVFCLFGVFNADLPMFVFLRGALLFFAMIAMNVGVVIFIQSGG
jgi:hypothetical protein